MVVYGRQPVGVRSVEMLSRARAHGPISRQNPHVSILSRRPLLLAAIRRRLPYFFCTCEAVGRGLSARGLQSFTLGFFIVIFSDRETLRLFRRRRRDAPRLAAALSGCSVTIQIEWVVDPSADCSLRALTEGGRLGDDPEICSLADLDAGDEFPCVAQVQGARRAGLSHALPRYWPFL